MAGNQIQVLDQGVGYGIVVGIGAFFALMMLALTYIQNKYTAYSTAQAEEFNTASRSVKPGLIAAGIVSSWTWSSTLLTSSTFAYSYGICGGMWYGAMGTSQILLFSLIAIKIKTKAPGAHTFPEIILARHGRVAHLTYLFFGLAANLLVGACLVLGGSQVVGALSGMNVYAACFLIPLVVGAYVIAGGLRSTFIADYAHTVILFIAIFVFGFSMYATDPVVGSIDRLYALLQEAGERAPIAGNALGGSYLTLKSNDGLVFAIDLLIAGFANVWLDQAYWQRAIASRPETSVRAYLAGGLAWYGIPFSFATIMGLGCAALTGHPAFPTYPAPLSAAQNGSGLSAPATAIALLGSGGAGLMLLLLFMAVTSSTSAELIAVSSLITFDMYKTYYKPAATSAQLVRVSHAGIVIWAVVLAAFCCILNAISLNLTWVLTVLGVIVGGASIPVGLILLWDRMSTVAALYAPWVGTALGLVAWFVVTKLRSGAINVDTTGDVTNALAGNLVAFGVGIVMAVILSLLFPGQWAADLQDPEARARLDKIDGANQRPASPAGLATTIEGEDPSREADAAASTSSSSPDDTNNNNNTITNTAEKRENPTDSSDPEKGGDGTTTTTPANPAADPHLIPTGNAVVDFLEASHVRPMSAEDARRATRLAAGFNIFYWSCVLVLVPFAMFGAGSRAELSLPGFRAWCVVSFLWVWCSMCVCVVWPVVESRAAMWRIAKGMLGLELGAEEGEEEEGSSPAAAPGEEIAGAVGK